MKIERCKGMRDFLPEEMEKFRQITEAFRDSCLKWGYEEVKTPTLEYLYLFTSAGTLTPGMLNRVYSFLDWDGWSGERVVLRPDVTIPVARLFTEHLADRELAKLFYIANTFAFEETGKKNRERWQCGAELIGLRSPLADVELIALALQVLRRLGLYNVEIKLSHAGLIRSILQKSGLNEEQQNQVFDSLLDGDMGIINKLISEKPELYPLFNLQGRSSGFVKNLISFLTDATPELKSQIDDFIFISDILQELGYNYRIDIASIRGFEYYTGMIFQLYADDEKIGGGGRYDALIPAMGGENTPASGFALYMDQLMQILPVKTSAGYSKGKIVIKMDRKSAKLGFDIADSLRSSGYIVKFHFGGKGPADVSWILEVGEKIPVLTLTRISDNKQFYLNSPEELLEKIQNN